MQLIIPFHSFVDLITNSSTEIYILASESTIKFIKQLVDNILTEGGSTKTFDDMFTAELSEVRERCYGSERDVIVKAKTDSENAKKAAEILSDLSGLFSIDGAYNG